MHAAGPKNPLHGITLERLLTELVDHYGWDMLGRMIQINCFTFHPSIKSSLIFLRRTPWARAKVEELYIDSIPDMTPEAKAAVEAAEAADRAAAEAVDRAEAEGPAEEPEEAAEAEELAKATEAAEGGITPDEDDAPEGEETATPAAEAVEASEPAEAEEPAEAAEAVELAKATEAAEGGITPDEDEARPAP